MEHRITMTDSEYEQVKQHIKNLLYHGIVKESHSPFAAPIVLAGKKTVLLECALITDD